MADPKVTIQFQNAQLGRVDDPGAGVPGMIVVMASAPSGHAFGDVKPYSTFDDLPTELQQVEGVKLFFAEAPGYKVFIMPVPDTSTVEDILDPLNANPYAKDLIEFDDDITFIGIVGKVCLLAAIATAGTNSKALRIALEPAYRYTRHFFGVAYDAALPDLGSADYTATGIVVSPSADHVGLLLGRRARIRVQRNVGRVKDGPLAIAAAELISGTPLEESTTERVEVTDKRYYALRVIVGKTGYYFTNDPLAVPASDDYARDAGRAVIDKAARLAYDTYVEELLDDIELDDDGTISTTAAKELQQLIENAISTTMLANEEVSSVRAYVDDSQNVASTDKVTIGLGITPKGYLEEIVVELGFETD